jgi:hypothetical protein
MTDVFGNYVVQKFLEHGGPEQRAAIAGVLKGQVCVLVAHKARILCHPKLGIPNSGTAHLLMFSLGITGCLLTRGVCDG